MSTTTKYMSTAAGIGLCNFVARFPSLRDCACVSLFRSMKSDVIQVGTMLFLAAPVRETKRNRYAPDKLLYLCVVLQKMLTLFRWRDVDRFFGKHAGQLSEVNSESRERFVDMFGALFTGAVRKAYMQASATRYVQAVVSKRNALEKGVGCIDGSVIGIT